MPTDLTGELRKLAANWRADAALFDALAEENSGDNRVLTARSEIARACAADLDSLLEGL